MANKITEAIYDKIANYVYDELVCHKFINIKHNTDYSVLDVIINSTNEQDGQVMIVYQKYRAEGTMTFCKEYKEFFIKFKQESFGENTFIPNHSENISKILGE